MQETKPITRPTWIEEFENMYPDRIRIFSPGPNIMSQTELDVVNASYELKRRELYHAIKKWTNDAYNQGIIDGAKILKDEMEK